MTHRLSRPQHAPSGGLSRGFVGFLCALVLTTASVLHARDQVDLREMIRLRIESSREGHRIVVGDELLHASFVLPRFYETRGFEPAWTRDGKPRPSVRELQASITDVAKEGLRPSDYHGTRIEALLGKIKDGGRGPVDARLVSDLELLCTDAFLILGAHLVSGRVDPEKIDSEWTAQKREVDLLPVLDGAVTSGRIREALQNLLPDHAGYHSLRRSLERYRELAASGGWSEVPPGAKLEVGVEDERVAVLRARLQASGDLRDTSRDGSLFDENLERAVRRFQRRHGLKADGVVGSATLTALNVSVADRVQQIVLNLERWRWLPQDLGLEHLLVNIPAFTVTVSKSGRNVMQKRVIVGREYRRTPVFSAKMTYLVLSPYWEVPPSIAVQDKLPEIRKDVQYLKRQGMRVFDGWGSEARELDPTSIDWKTLHAGRFPYRLRQDPGPLNALGTMKFMFPNRFNVYLHDTPQRDLFERETRNFSSGCIRVENPFDLAEHLLGDRPEWTREKMQEAIDKRVPVTVALTRPISVHLLYWTAWADPDDTLEFRDDIYKRDGRLSEALSSVPPESKPN